MPCVYWGVCICEQKGAAEMELDLIYGGKATLEDLCKLHELGFEFVVEGGEITDVSRTR